MEDIRTITTKSIFRDLVIEIMALKVLLHNIKLKYIDPKEAINSKKHDEMD